MKTDFQIQIVARGEGITYREAGHEYNFDIHLGQRPYRLYADSYWDGTMPPRTKQLTEEEKTRIIPRLIEFIKGKERDAGVDVRWERDSVPLKTSWELFVERRRARGTTD